MPNIRMIEMPSIMSDTLQDTRARPAACSLSDQSSTNVSQQALRFKANSMRQQQQALLQVGGCVCHA